MKRLRLIPLYAKGKEPRHSRTARILHWSYSPAVLAGIFSGLYINRPRSIFGFKNMDSARKTHFVALFALLCSYLARVCYGLKNKNYREVIPGWQTFKKTPQFLKHEFFLTGKKRKYPKYNPGQKILFAGFAFFIGTQIITGLALYYSHTWQKTIKLAGGLNYLRQLHFLTALANIVLVAGHIYFALTHGLKKLKSIFTGYE